MKKSAPLLLVFLILTFFILSSSKFLSSNYIDANLLIMSNAFFLLISLISMAIQAKGLKNKNPNVFIRSVMSGMILKMFCSMIAVVIYVYASGKQFNKRGVFISLFIYLIYLATEVYTVMKLNKKSNA